MLISACLMLQSYGQVTSGGSLWPFAEKDVVCGSERTDKYLEQLSGKKVAVVANPSSKIKKTPLVDSLLSLKVKIVKIFAPEHGFRGDAEAGKGIADGKDLKTGIPVVSLFGQKFKPTAEDMKGIDLVVFDIQDVGVRFFTYISTLHYVMEACAENKIPLLILDRPNPNAFYIDGPVLEKQFSSFVGMHPVPVVYGMTIAEYARMINGEGWLKNGIQCNLSYVTLEKYNHNVRYALPVPPSPNLGTMAAVYLYPSLCFFEGTPVSVGRGTDYPFEVIGYPDNLDFDFSFTPRSIPGKCVDPMYLGKVCKGYKLSEFADVFIKNAKQLYLFWLIGMYQGYPDKDKFFTAFFDKLAGTDQLRKQIISGKKEEEIRESWKPALGKFKEMRQQYLLYPDF